MDPAEAFFTRGWVKFGYDPKIASWVDGTVSAATATVADPDLRAQWLRCGGTWFAGVNALPNNTDGRVDGASDLAGAPIDFVRQTLGFEAIEWDLAQISVCYSGYPQPWEGESEAAFRFRRDRDAAHVDGLMRIPPSRDRRLGEVHGFILGLPLSKTHPDAAPLVVYEGSHEIIRAAFNARFADLPPEKWADEIITEAYVEARRHVFETCPRVTIAAEPGESYLVHRLAVHGVSKWDAPVDAPPRMIAYFRPNPLLDRNPGWWLARR